MNLARIDLPKWSLMAPATTPPGTYVDCDYVDVAHSVDLRDFVAAFYGTPLFLAERLVLQLALRRRIPDAEVIDLAEGRTDRFAAWTVAGRLADQLWLADVTGATMSWLAVRPQRLGTRLFFGSVVRARGGRMPIAARILLPAHKLYARGLLRAAARALL
ncbi:hypothetical protein [Jannaschia faecimaris]|nr:hypothetical protein [Jannaschia faecimaris]